MTDKRAEKVAAIKAAAEDKFGLQSQAQAFGRACSTGSLLWDYMTGVGGHRMGALHEVFGGFSIGKTTIAGFGALRSAQGMGMTTGIIGVEPNITEDWMIKNGVDPAYNIIHRPDTGEEAFEILRDWVYDGPDFILFDSIGAISSNKEQESDKPQAYGNAALITWGVSRIVVRAWKNNVGVLFLNQQRDDTKSRIAGMVDSPGGHGFKHDMLTRTHLKPGKDRYTIKMNDGYENKDVMVGRQVVASFKKNKAAEALGKSARFDFYHMETEQYGFGIDVAKDVMAAAKVSGVFESSGAWIRHPIFPSGKLNGMKALTNWIGDNPDKLPEIRAEVLKVMDEEENKKSAAKAQLKAVK